MKPYNLKVINTHVTFFISYFVYFKQPVCLIFLVIKISPHIAISYLQIEIFIKYNFIINLHASNVHHYSLFQNLVFKSKEKVRL